MLFRVSQYQTPPTFHMFALLFALLLHVNSAPLFSTVLGQVSANAAMDAAADHDANFDYQDAASGIQMHVQESNLDIARRRLLSGN